MRTIIVDASVAVKWFLPEEGAAEAKSLLNGTFRLLAPDLLWIEVGSVAWKIARRGDLTPAEAEQIVRDAAAFPVEIVESLPLLPSAIRIATEADRSIYDSLYVALAARERASVVTADDRLANALRHTDWSSLVTRIGDLR